VAAGRRLGCPPCLIVRLSVTNRLGRAIYAVEPPVQAVLRGHQRDLVFRRAGTTAGQAGAQLPRQPCHCDVLRGGQRGEAVPLANLAATEAVALLRREGLTGADAARVTRFTHGHPLALRLAASAQGARPDLTVPDAAIATVVTELARVYLSGLDQRSRAVLDAACTLRRPTMSLLGALLPDVPPNDAYDMLRPLPFVEFGPDGLVLHDTVREVVAALLRINDPPAYRAHRIAAWRQLRRELRTAPPGTCGATPPTCSTSSRTRPCGRRSSLPPASGTRSSRPGRPMRLRSPPSPARTSQPGQSP
jgi:hypothetical protein